MHIKYNMCKRLTHINIRMSLSVTHKYLLSILLSARLCTYSWDRQEQDNIVFVIMVQILNNYLTTVTILPPPYNKPNTTINFSFGTFVKKVSLVLKVRCLFDKRGR